MKPATILTAACAGLAWAVPTKIIERADNCEQWGSVVTGDYTVYNNLWNQAAASSGEQCFSVDSLSGNTIAWSSTWSWTGGQGQVKSYPNAVYNPSTESPKQLSAISSMQSSWDWSYEGTGLVADVAYDLFTSSTPDGDEEFEIMVWLAAIGGAGPISSTYSADGSATSIGSATIGGVTFDLYKGPNGQMTVYSFVAPTEVKSFSADMKLFFDYLVENEGFEESQYLISAGAGTEPFEGSGAVFRTSKYVFGIE
ncbi:Putative glycoside hydrolase family 12, glycoside hydrolase family 11/12 [Septoria linicola]|uniref:Glycoside hydrolase family 12, glycoside hydrolase family 11/12 n=1 Tax=Septoria linicola TaxID=215465 RepID=A0A9Q9ANX0_9PEZI|nr:putative glycoside hydrolase family 12, glycoside hydrolase family 11/12 [Septoria linicola]USW50438.1 Putative glycoside hydrolase family 12, glycoside hydrolase family 11/12 [Septoria linicola]